METKDDFGLITSTNKSEICVWDLEPEEKKTLFKTSSSFKKNLLSTPTTQSPIKKEKKPKIIIPGESAIMKYLILNDKIRLLAEDNQGNVTLWDITKGKKIEDFGKINMNEKFKELNEIISVQNWVSIETKLGCLQIVLENPRCFNSEVYGLEAGFQCLNEEKVNYGQLMVTSLFRYWYQNYIEKLRKNPDHIKEKEKVKKEEDFQIRNKLIHFDIDENIRVIIHHEKDNIKYIQYSKKIKEFKDELEGIIPSWVVDCFYNPLPEGTTNHKISFSIESLDPQEIPTLTSKLNAHRILRISKVSDFVITSLKYNLPKKEEFEKFKNELKLETEKKSKKIQQFVKNVSKHSTNETILPEEYLEISCNGHIIDPKYNLGIVYSFFRDNQPNIILKYKLKI